MGQQGTRSSKRSVDPRSAMISKNRISNISAERRPDLTRNEEAASQTKGFTPISNLSVQHLTTLESFYHDDRGDRLSRHRLRNHAILLPCLLFSTYLVGLFMLLLPLYCLIHADSNDAALQPKSSNEHVSLQIYRIDPFLLTLQTSSDENTYWSLGPTTIFKTSAVADSRTLKPASIT